MEALKEILLFCQYMVVTEEIVKCWMCSDRPITHRPIAWLRVPYLKDTANTPYVSDVLLKSMCHTPMVGIEMKSSNSSIFVSMNVTRISRMNYAEMYLKECVLILSMVKLSLMSVIEKVFHFNENQINVVKCNNDIWFKGKDIANSLGYENPGKAITIHVDSDDKMSIDELLMVSKGGSDSDPLSKGATNQGPLLKSTIKGPLSTSMSHDCTH